MSKKNKKKFQKKGSRPVAAFMQTAGAGTSEAIDIDSAGMGLAETPVVVKKTALEMAEEDPRYAMVQKDVRKIILTLGALAVLLAVVVVAENKTGVLDSLGEWIYRISNIQVQ